jgi:hypothetical protein
MHVSLVRMVSVAVLEPAQPEAPWLLLPQIMALAESLSGEHDAAASGAARQPGTGPARGQALHSSTPRTSSVKAQPHFSPEVYQRFMRMMSLLVREQLRTAARSSLAAYLQLWMQYACPAGSPAALAGEPCRVLYAALCPHA